MDDNADAKRILLASPPADWRRQLGHSPHHMAQHHPTGSETSPSYAPRSSGFGSEPPSVEDDVDVWRYAIVSCMPETTTTTLPAPCRTPYTETFMSAQSTWQCGKVKQRAKFEHRISTHHAVMRICISSAWHSLLYYHTNRQSHSVQSILCNVQL